MTHGYISYIIDLIFYIIISEELGETIKKGSVATDKIKAKTMIFLRYHLHEDLKNEYLTVKDP